MAKSVINSFNAGELSPYLYARTDLDKYSSGCLTMENFVPLPYGGAVRRPALEFLGISKQDDAIRLIPFKASVSSSYALEFGTGYIRFWKDGAVILNEFSQPLEIGSPYTDTELNDIKIAQSVDVMWLAHPSHPVQRISRTASDAFTIIDEPFDFPPLMAENDTDITMSPSGTTGTITLTSSQDFFDANHVGAYFKFNAVRNKAQKSISGNFTTTSFSTEMNASNCNWEVTTSDTWLGLLILQRSLDGGVTWEDYITIGNTLGVAASGERNLSASSDEPEPFNSRLRLHFVGSSTTCGYELKLDNPYFESLVKIVGYTDAQNVTAEVIGEFQDIPSDYAEYSTLSGTISAGTKAYIDSGIDHVVGSDVALSTIDAGLTNITGMDFGLGYFWFVTSDAASRKIWKVDSALTAVESGFPVDISSEISSIYDITLDSTHLYICGADGQYDPDRVRKYDLSGVFVSEPYSQIASLKYGLGYNNGYFYMSYIPKFGITTGVEKYNSSFTYTGISISSTSSTNTYTDICGIDNKIYITDSVTATIGIYNESLSFIGSVDINGQTTTPSGIAYDGTNLYVCDATTLYKYELTDEIAYYECVSSHTYNADFSAVDQSWSKRTPEMTTWTEGAFSDYRGHPQAVGLFENRLCYAGTDSEPDALWLGVIDDYQNFRTGSLATDGMKLVLGSGGMDEIRWLVPQERLVIGTSGGEWSVGASDNRKAITPTGYDLKRKTTYGSSGVQAILVNSAVLFPMRQGRKVREWPTTLDVQDYTARDLTVLSEHITNGGIQSWDFQQQPDNILWCVRVDGDLLGFTYERDQNVFGWHRHSSDLLEFESVCVLPRLEGEDEVLFSVKITVDGDVKRYICRFNDREWGTNYLTEWRGSDLYKVYTNPGTSNLTGLDYLEGHTVSVVADGNILEDEVVSNGNIKIDSNAYTTVVVGLPFTSTLAPIYLEAEGQFGSTQGTKRDVKTASVMFKDTYSAKISSDVSGNIDSVVFDEDESPLHNGYGEAWFDNESEFLKTCYIIQDEPMPCQVLAMIPNVRGR